MKYRAIEVDAPYVLQPGQNFYDQPPFIEMFGHLEGVYGNIQLSRFRTTATKISHNEFPETPVGVRKGTEIKPVAPEQTIIRLATSKGRLNPLLEESFTVLNRLLEEYPALKKYIATQLEKGSYTESGDRSKTQRSAFEDGTWLYAADSYANWVTRRLRRAVTLGRARQPGDINIETAGILTAKQINEELATGELVKAASHRWTILRVIQ